VELIVLLFVPYLTTMTSILADTVSPPWVLKPRSEASASGIIKVFDKESLWMHINEMGNNRFKYLLKFKPRCLSL
jgi:hypothetical protein